MKEFFFNVISVRECQEILSSFPRLGSAEIDFNKALGRYLAEDIFSPENLPAADRASMDGYAVRAAEVFGANEGNPAYLEQSASIEIGEIPDFALEPGHCAAIVTGGYLPVGADAVVMVEHTQNLGAGTIEIRRSLAPHDNVMLRGEDAAEGQLVLPRGSLLRAQEIGFLAALGVVRPQVYHAPKVAVISTGDELVPAAGTQLAATGADKNQKGKIRDVNSPALAALINGANHSGMQADCLGIVPDQMAALSDAVNKALPNYDVVLLSGGSSVGTRDYTVEVLSALPGAQIVVQGVAMSPGKPLIVAKVETAQGIKAVIGLPGQVTSAQVVMHVLILPFLRHLSGMGASSASALAAEATPSTVAVPENTRLSDAFSDAARLTRPALLSRNLASRQGREDYIRVRLEQSGNNELPLAHPIQGKSGLVRTMVEAHGLLRIPADLEGFVAGSQHEIILL